jgi:hypothetical protein
VQEALRRTGDSPYITSPALAEFKTSVSPEQTRTEPIAVGFEDRLMGKILEDASRDSHKKQSEVVIAAMASELRDETAVVSK